VRPASGWENPEADVNEHEALVDQAVRTKHTVLLIGGMDTGKSTLSRELLAAALAAGRPAAFLDADVGQKTVGPLRRLAEGRSSRGPGASCSRS
jgi:polynucleotide 5'-kinase involved in rRNA processing